MLQRDVIVVGGGFAGMRAALAAKEGGADVALVSKVHPLRSHSSGAHSGINAALSSEDSWQIHAKDTIQAGDYLGDQDAIQIMCQEGIEDVIKLEHMGVIFSRNDNGRIDVMPFAGSTRPRTCYVGDSAGHIILQVLYEQMLKLEIPIYSEWFVTSLLVEHGVCLGVIAQELSSGRLLSLAAKAVVLATGGLGRMYDPSTASYGSTADGQALAYRAGIPLVDMEMVQYHPTTLMGKGVVITEAARGEGAYLVNKDGKRFMESYAPKTLEMAARDVCSRGVETEVTEGRGVNGGVLLDFRHLDADRLEDRLPETRYLVSKLSGIDIKEEPVPVLPAMHRPIGGVEVDVQGATSLPGLYAAGECACVGLHGANRLGGNSLLESVVFGRRAGEAAASYAESTIFRKPPESQILDQQRLTEKLTTRNGGGDTIGSLRRELTTSIHSKLGTSRDGAGLRDVVQKVSELKERYGGVALSSVDGPYNPSLSALLELGYLLDVAEIMAVCAQARQESRGAHYRSDFPNRDDTNWLKHTVASYTPNGPTLTYKPVVITQQQPEERSY